MAIKNWLPLPAALALTACVTINVYFPAAEAREAAREFVDKVIGEEATPSQETSPQKPEAGGGLSALLRRIDPWSLLGIGSAYAQSAPDISINTPAIRAIQSQMQSRFDSTLRAGFDSGALGFTQDGMVTVRDAGKLELKDRVTMNAAVADDNRDRKALYREVAVANGHPEWEGQIREVFARQWIERAHAGWWYQSAAGWKQK